MKARAVSLALAVGLFTVAWWFALRPGGNAPPASRPAAPDSPAATVARETGSPTPTVAMATPFVAATPAGAPPSATPAVNAVTTTDTGVRNDGGAPARRDPQIEIDQVRTMMRDYHTLEGENPVGTNAEIMQALMGGNKRQATLGPPEGVALNAKGELTDPWGTPYFFHQLSKDKMEIHSAGPDRTMGTPDDLVAK